MLTVATILATAASYEQLLEALRNTPGMTWTPAIPKQRHTLEELKTMLMQVPEKPFITPKKNIPGIAPESVNWVERAPECVDVVRDQGHCGSCWAFSAVSAFSGRRCITKKDATRVQYSEEHVLACDPLNLGCLGGYLTYVQDFLQAHGTTTDACISYKSGDGVTRDCPMTCDDGSPIPEFVKSSSYADVCASEESIKSSVAEGPIMTTFRVYDDFKLYESGVYQHVYGDLIGDHAVEFVGYGEEDSVKYWLVKNSWGTEWGDRGYFKILRGANECGIERECLATYFE